MCKDPKQCQSHDCTLKEIADLKEENEKFRKELNDLKELVHNLTDIEKTIKEIYKHHRHPIINSIKKFFEGGN